MKRWRALLSSERDAEQLYSRLADAETGERRKIFEELASIERRHAPIGRARFARPGLRCHLPAGPVCARYCSVPLPAGLSTSAGLRQVLAAASLLPSPSA
ncbi:MAG: hypothetical protein WCC38_05345 [Pseudonocardiaceae bacterium]